MEHNRVIYERPYDAEVEYLESTGTQWIDTGIMPDNTYTFDCKVAKTLNKYNCVFWGTRNSGNSRSENNQCYLNSNDISGGSDRIRLINLYSTSQDASSNWSSNIIPSINTMYELTDMTVVPTMNSMIYPITLFAFNIIGDINTGLGKCRIGYWKCYSNGQIVCDFIPVRKGNIGYMYDKVSGKLFGNQGTGNFILGQDVANPVPKIRNVVYYSPYDAEVEYLESTGTQWINTDVIPTRTTHTQVYKSFTRSDKNLGGDGIYHGRNIRFHDGIYEGKFHFGIGNSQNWVNTIIADTNKHLFELFGSGYAKLDGTTYNISNGYDTYNWEFALFRRIGANEFTGEQIVYCKIYQEDTLVRDFIPVRRGTKGYMYDKVSKKLFGNQGTGRFILGNDVVKPNFRCIIPMPYDSKIEYLESTGTQYIDLDYRCSANTIASVTVLPTQMKLQQRFIGSSSAYFEIYHNGSGYYSFASHDNIHTSTTTFASSTKVNLTTKRNLTINNVTSRGIVDSTITNIYKNAKFGQLYLLTRPSYHPVRAAVCKLYAASVIDGDFKMDLIPVRKNGVGYMYDRVSGKLFGNAGTGQFILGNDIN